MSGWACWIRGITRSKELALSSQPWKQSTGRDLSNFSVVLVELFGVVEFEEVVNFNLG